MAPFGPGKRKRGDQAYFQDDVSRPSPHRPGNLDLARQNQPSSPSLPREAQDGRGRGFRRSSRGGRASTHFINNRVNDVNDSPASAPRQPIVRATPTPTPGPSANTSQSATTIQEALPDVPYDYNLLSDNIRKSWTSEGKEVYRQRVAAATEAEDDITMLRLMQETVHAVCSRSLPPTEVGEVLQEMLNSEKIDRPALLQSALLDCVSVFCEDALKFPAQELANFLAATGISEDALRLELDQPLLLKLGLISGRFKQMAIRKTTNILYRQANFNLMREESEGFAKLITELFMTSGNEPPTREVVHQTVEKIKAMIGAFDLDVGRSLDVVLDVFGSVLVRHFRFLVRLLRASPWWPQTHSQLGDPSSTGGLPLWAEPESSDVVSLESGKQQSQLTLQTRDREFWLTVRDTGLLAFQQLGRAKANLEEIKQAGEAAEDDLRSQWIRETHSIPPNGNRDAAQLLGFKLRFYSSSAARDPNETLPDNLIHLSALLIKIGFISLNDLYPHIWRSDEEMEELKQVKTAEKAERDRAARPGAGVKNALAMAGALADDTVPAPTTRLRDSTTRPGTPARDTEAQKPPVKEVATEPSDQKVTLLKSLLAIGALPEALFILGRFPWIVDLYPEVPEYIHRILHHCLSHVYNSLQPLQHRDSLRIPRPSPQTDIPSIPKGQAHLIDALPKKTLKWANLDRDDSGDGTDYRFYWDDWNDNIPLCRDVDDVFALCQTLLTLVGVKIGQDPSLVLKLTRIGKHSLTEDTSEANRKRWLDLIKRVLLPSLSLTKSNAGVVNEVFELMSHYPTTTRFVMYLEWSTGRTSRNQDIKAAFEQAKAETKDILKRISKTNVKPMARALARIAYANPHIVITTALTQIEVYDSIAEVFVEGARYFTDLGYDVLTWAMISSMGRAGRSRTQDGGIFASRWLSALSQFAGKIYKRYNMMRPGPILQYVADQLNKGNPTDLKMLEQIVSAMGGIANDNNFNDTQLLAMGGGPLLQSQTILQLLDRRSEAKVTSKRLVKALQDHNLTAKLLVLMAQQKQACVFEDGEVPLKAIANTFDEINRVMTQYLDLLRANLGPEEFESTIPDIADLLIVYEIPAEIAFWIARPNIRRRMAELDRETAEAQKSSGNRATDDDVAMADDVDDSEEDGEAIDVDEVLATAASPSEYGANGAGEPDDVEQAGKLERWHPVLQPLMESLNKHLPEGVVSVIGTGFYVTFWQLSLYDIYVPSKAYEDEMGRQKKKIAAITADRSSISASSARQREATVKNHQHIIDELLKENRQHLKAYNESKARLNREKDQWFANKQRSADLVNVTLMEHCFLPRVLASPQDAFFCFKFLKLLHTSCTANFRTVGFYDMIFKAARLSSLFFMCTSQEAESLGKFLREILQDLARWHKNKTIYEREAFGSKKNLTGFARSIENGKVTELLDHDNFTLVLFKWHSNVYSALTSCLSSSEYMHVRNAITVLRAISSVFPAVQYHGTELQKAVGKLRTSDLEDLKTASAALLGALHRRTKEWIDPKEFSRKTKTTGAASFTTPMAEGESESKIDVIKSSSDNDQASETRASDTPVKLERAELKLPIERSRPASRTGDLVKETPRAISNAPTTPRPESDSGRSDRRSGRVNDSERPHGPSRRVSPGPRQTPPINIPVRSESEQRNGYRESPRTLRPTPSELGRPERGSAYPRHTLSERSTELPHEAPHRYSRGHERPLQPERDDRSHRREYEPRHIHDERRQQDRDTRLERDLRNDRDAPRPDREYGRLQHEPERKRPDLLEDRRPAPSASSRTSTQVLSGAINPERAAQINSSESRSGMNIRGHAQDKPRGSRPSSPRRDDDRRYQSRGEREEREERPERPERLDRRPESSSRLPPSPAQPGPRSAVGNSAFGRESRQQTQQTIDMQHGRLEPESPQRPPTRSERPADNEVPSGPRQRPAPAPRTRGSSANNQAPPERAAPTGPSRHGRNSSVQEPSAKQQDATGVHPDRLNQIAAVEPPRGPQRPAQGPPPSGPRNVTTTPPAGPSSVPRGAPTGPQVDGLGRGRRNPIDTLNNTLAQAQGPVARGRGTMRQGNGPAPAQMPPPGPGSRPQFGASDPTNPNGMPVQPRPPSRRDSSKDLRADGEARSARNRSDNRDEVRPDELRRSDRRDDHQSRDPKGPRMSQGDEMSARKHPREDGAHYGGGYLRGGSRGASDNKRPRRGG